MIARDSEATDVITKGRQLEVMNDNHGSTVNYCDYYAIVKVSLVYNYKL